MTRIRFDNCTLLDTRVMEYRPGASVLVEGDEIREVTDGPMTAGADVVVDAGGRTVMPGLIDCHVHVLASDVNLGRNAQLPNVFATLRALPILKGMLARGFTTVRDAGGADWSLAQAVATGLVEGPRIFASGKALSQTGGHGDFRARGDQLETCACSFRIGAIARVVDGVDAVRLAAREELQMGASQIKIMASGGVASPTDPIANTQYSIEEICAIVAEAEAAQTYVMAHAYTPRAIARAVANGVRTIEHGNLVDDEAAALMARHGAYAVPTLVTYDTLAAHGARLGFPAESIGKIDGARLAGRRSLEVFARHGVPMGFGTDLLGDLHAHQGEELRIRAEVLGTKPALASATTVAAEIVRMPGRLGVLAPGAVADLLLVDGDPLADIGVLTGQGERLTVVMQAGRFVHNRLGQA